MAKKKKKKTPYEEKEADIQMQALRILNKHNQTKTSPWYIVVKMSKHNADKQYRQGSSNILQRKELQKLTRSLINKPKSHQSVEGHISSSESK